MEIRLTTVESIEIQNPKSSATLFSKNDYLKLWDTMTAALNVIHDGVVVYDSEKKLVFANQRHKEIYPDLAELYSAPGTPLSAILTAHAHALKRSDPDLDVRDYVYQRIKCEVYKNTEHETSDGHWINSSLFQSKDGGFITTRQDITAYKNSLNSLRISEEKYSTVIETQTDLVTRFTKDGTFTFANRAYCEFVGKTEEELLGTPIYQDVQDSEHIELKKKFSLISIEHSVQKK